MTKNTIMIDLGKVINSCFVVMPFNQLFQTQYENIIQPAISELGVKCVRGDEIYERQRIMDDIWKSIRECRFLVAELTGRNPNVLYEIGLAHAIGKPIIIITRNSEDVPFDLKDLRYLYYDVNDPFWGDNLKNGLQKIIKKIIESPEIDNYLDGISKQNKIEFPALKIQSKIETEKKTKIYEVSGSWKGAFDLNGTHDVLLQINQTGTELVATAVITYYISDKLTVVQEIMHGSIKYSHVTLTGVNYTYVERGESDDYTLDVFKLQLYNSKNIMEGKSSNLGEPDDQVEIKFEKINNSHGK